MVRITMPGSYWERLGFLMPAESRENWILEQEEMLRGTFEERHCQHVILYFFFQVGSRHLKLCHRLLGCSWRGLGWGGEAGLLSFHL